MIPLYFKWIKQYGEPHHVRVLNDLGWGEEIAGGTALKPPDCYSFPCTRGYHDLIHAGLISPEEQEDEMLKWWEKYYQNYYGDPSCMY